jgi:ElaB/YqjD/DUF883 family membrane-anchored ribosome-binding protein
MNERRQSQEARATWSRSMTDPAAGAGSGVFDSTREFAARALESAAERMRDLRHGVADTAGAAQRTVHRYTSATSRYIADQPLRSALVAAGVGALVMAAILMARRRGSRL